MPPKKKKTDSGASGNEAASLKCFICKMKLKSENQVETHVNDEHGPRFNCQCAHCTGKRRHDSSKLVEEVDLKDGDKDVKVFKCIVCSYQVFLLCKCLSHIQTAHNTVSLQKQYECMKCNVGFEKCLELHNHILQDHPQAQKIARCGFSHCKNCFSTASMLQAHLRQNHKVTKPFELLNNIKGTPMTGVSLPGGGSGSDSTAAASSAWTAPDPPSPPPAAPSVNKEEPDPDLTCKICKKTHKSQTSYNNHMLVFHKEKYVSSCKPAKKRRRDDDSDTSSDDADSEDSDWAPSNTRTKRSSRVTRASKKPPAKGDNPSGGKVKGRNASGGSLTEAGSDTSGMNNEATQGSSVASSGTAQSTTQHHDEDHDEHDDCLACKQAKLKANPPPVRIKQEPLDPSEVSNMPVISNVFSMTPTTNTEPLTNGFDDSKSTTSTTVLYNGNDDHDRPASVGSDYSTATEKGNTGFNVMSGSSPSTGWQPLAAMPSSGANVQADNMCTSCLAQKPNQNKCEHCGIIFLEPTMHMIHMLWHGEKHPFQCHTCGVICKDKYSFTTHIFKAQHLNI